MNIGIVSPYYMHLSGGVQNLIKDLQLFLSQQGHQVLIIAPRPHLEENVEHTPSGILLLGASVEINFKNPFHTTFPIAHSQKDLITDFLLDQNFDILNIHEPWMPFLPYQILQAAHCPVVGTTHARWPRSLLNKSLEKLRSPYFKAVIKRVDQMTAVSAVAARNVVDIYEDYPVNIIPNGINYQEFSKATKKSQPSLSSPFMLFLNRLEKRKGPKLLLKAYRIYAQEMGDQALPLIIAGRGPQKRSLEAYVANYNLGHLIHFEGYVSHERKLELMSTASLYVSPAPYGESFGIVLLEAMAANLPIVAGNNAGYRGVLKDTGAQSLINPYKSSYFAKHLQRLGHQEEIRKEWQAWAATEIQKYDFAKIGAAYEACFQQAVKQPTGQHSLKKK